MCSERCRGIGLSYCFGLTTDKCCSFYESNACVSECSEGRVPDEDFKCVCRTNYLEPDCTGILYWIINAIIHLLFLILYRLFSMMIKVEWLSVYCMHDDVIF